MNVFFVCGAPKSGTTWLQRLLDAHPQVACAGEGHFIERFTAPLSQLVSSYNRQMLLEVEEVYEGRPAYGPVNQAEFDEVARTFILNRMMSRRAGPEVRWIGDKTPRYTHYLPQLHRLFPAARIIHIVRDPRDVAVSRMAHSKRAGAPDALTPGTEPYWATVKDAVQLWNEAVRDVDAFAAAHPRLVHELRYCDLQADPAAETARLFGFLGVDTGAPLLERVVAAASFEALSGRRPGEEDPDSFLRKGVSGDWKTQLDPPTAQLVLAACGELMRAKGFAG